MIESDELDGWQFTPPPCSGAGSEDQDAGDAGGAGGAAEGSSSSSGHSTSSPSQQQGAEVSCGLAHLPVQPQSLTERLETSGFVVFDNAAGPAYCATVRQEIMTLFEAGLLQPSKNKLATRRHSDGTVADGHELPKIGVFELDLVVNGEVRAEHVLGMAPCINKFWLEDGPKLVRRLTTACPTLALSGIDTIKLQYNNGSGGCFPMHYDTSSSHSEREMTAILYLNDAWEPGDGGELRVFPFPLEPVDFAPLNDRLALFNSTEMLHRVMPANAPRVCLSMWFARTKAARPVSLPLRLPRELASEESAGVMKIVFNPSNRRLFSKVLFADEWEQSFRDAFGATAQVGEALALNKRDVLSAAARINADLLQVVRSCLPMPLPSTLAAPIDCDAQPRHGNGRADADAAAGAGEDSDGGKGTGAGREAGEAREDAAPVPAKPITGSFGAMYCPKFLKTVEPLYDMHMGVENMAPLLYSLLRFHKPRRILEVGAGYTSVFLLQALKDNATEMAMYAQLIADGKCNCDGTPWAIEDFVHSDTFGVLECVDNLEHASTTAQKILEAAEKLDLLDHLDLYFQDAWEFADKEEHQQQLDIVWLDFGQGEKVGQFIDKVWSRIRPGGLVLCHSTLTNSLTRDWLEKMRARANDVTDVLGSFATFSMREPHKLFQNSFSIFQKRKDFAEPTFTKYP